ncbi:transposase [Phormidium sp. LEGE 05292]|uniref:Mu transposase C-terminal domain-containing protein n=1 Tax=[Phormidium] sp. LEGE 05292 TaxID=767427 RepID=UPI0018829FAA|nr:DDE-type integrase/transposase/recombinase [Phormidium sp. LEGE 05292]MBE9229677.1 transposase [Phormidium sp. LEGE 05292]
MSRVKFQVGLHFWLLGREYVIKQRLTGEDFQISDVVTENLSIIKETVLVQSLFKGSLEFENPARPLSPPKKDYLAADFSQIPESLKQEAKIREKYVRATLEKNFKTRTKAELAPIIEQVAQSIKDATPPSYITLYRWLKIYEDSGQDIRALVPNYRKRGDYRPKISPEVKRIIDSAIARVYLNPNRAKVDAVYDEVVAEIVRENCFRKETGMELLKIPHRSTIYRFVLKLEPLEKAVARYGKKAAEKMYAPLQHPVQVTRPLERVEIDHTKLPFFVVDNETRLPIGTPALTSAVDKYSGLVVGYYLSFEPFSSLSVMQCLLNAIRPKDYVKSKFPSVQHDWNAYGLMETLVVDNGKEFLSEHFKDACQQLQIHVQYTPPKMPWYKGSIERYFGMLNTKILAGQPGNLLSDFVKDYDYDPQKNAVVSFEALQEMIHLFIIDIHNQNAHPEFKCPRSEVWSRAIDFHPPALPPYNKELRVLVGLIEKRVISRRGVEWSGLYYNCPDLVRLRSYFEPEDKRRKDGTRVREKALIKIDPNDISTIYVFEPTSDNFIAVPALAVEYTTGLTLWQHKVIKNLAAQEYKKVDIVALALAKKKIQEIVEREWLVTKKGKTRTAMARWFGIGREGFNTGYQTEQILDLEATPPLEQREAFDASNQSHPMTGISDRGSAFHFHETSPLSDSDSNRVEETAPVNSVTVTLDTSADVPVTQKPSKRLRNQKTAPQKGSPVPKETETFNSKNSWEPDLTGWDVSIGLPTYSNEANPNAEE